MPMFHVVTSSSHANEQNPEFSIHVSDLGPFWVYYYMHLNALLSTNRNKWLALYMGLADARHHLAPA